MKSIYNLLSRLILSQKYIAPETNDLTGKVILITGASKGIGKATSEVLLKAGASVVLVSRSNMNLKKEFPKFDMNKILAISADVSSEKDMANALDKTLKRFGRIDILINNAGQNIDKALDETAVSEFNEIINTNLLGTFIACKKVLPIMKKQKSGTIINIGSKISHNTNVASNKVLYATSKYAIEGFSFALNKELKKFGIRVVCLMPGTVNTFVSRNMNNFMSPYDVGAVILDIIKLDNIDFESVVFKSIRQNI